MRTSTSATKTPIPKRMFLKDEDELLKQLVARFGTDNWDLIASYMTARNARQCKDRWSFYLDPNVNTAPYSIEEDSKLLDLVKKHGPRWVQIVSFFDKRTSYSIKNRWQYLQRALKKFGANATVEQIHELPKPRTKPGPRANRHLTKKDTSSEETTTYSSSSLEQSCEERSPITTPDVKNEIIPINEPPKQEIQQQKQTFEEEEADPYMSPRSEYFYDDGDDFNKFF